jgi:hypothetical protein|eukprot:SAG25_NODE_45_length_19261_cov_61.009815_18_plen_125_part_00
MPDGDDWHSFESNAAEWDEIFSGWLQSPMLHRWFASNCHWSTVAKPTKLTCIPIGLENHYVQKRTDRPVNVDNYPARPRSWTVTDVTGAATAGHLVLVDFLESRIKPFRTAALKAVRGSYSFLM